MPLPTSVILTCMHLYSRQSYLQNTAVGHIPNVNTTKSMVNWGGGGVLHGARRRAQGVHIHNQGFVNTPLHVHNVIYYIHFGATSRTGRVIKNVNVVRKHSTRIYVTGEARLKQCFVKTAP